MGSRQCIDIIKREEFDQYEIHTLNSRVQNLIFLEKTFTVSYDKKLKRWYLDIPQEGH